jgi:ATP-dependent helicase/nuclease subunit B
MKLLVGLGYDSRKPNNQKAQFNTLVCGEAGLLAELEFRGGISVKPQHQAERIVLVMEAIKRTMTPERFYYESFSTDPLACTEELLRWSDWLSLHGWQQLPGSDFKGRLSDLEDIRSNAKTIAPAIGERVFSLLKRLPLLKRPIETIELVDPLSHWEPVYQYLFKELQAFGIPVIELCTSLDVLADEKSDLGRLQKAIVNDCSDELQLIGDGSLHCYTTSNLQTGANYVVQRADSQHLIIAGGQHYALNTAAIHNGFSEPGLGESSALRAPNQLLPLMLQCLWSPPSAPIVQQYLTLPAGKHQRLRQRLARYFADQPGYNIPLWEKTISEYAEIEVKRDDTINAEKFKLDIASWLPVGNANHTNEMEVSLAIEVCAMTSEYWRALIFMSENGQRTQIYTIAQQSTDALSDALRNWSAPIINKEQLNRLLDIVSDVGNSVYKLTRKVSELDIIETPESSALVCDTPNHLIWWDFKLGKNTYCPPFNAEELSCVPLFSALDTSREHAQLQRALAALLKAKTSITIIALDDTPDLLKLSLTKLTGENAWQTLDDMLLKNKVSEIPCSILKDLPLPAEQRWWEVSSTVPSPRDKESYSSLSSLALRPHEYALRYSAKLKEGSLVSLPFDARLKGNLSHKIVENWLVANPWQGKAPSQQEIDDWLDHELDAIIFSTALPLTAPGMRSERFKYVSQIRHAMLKLFEHIEKSDIQEILVEHKLDRAISTTCVEGTIDLLGKLSDGRWVIIDMKWGSRKRYQEELKNGLYLQLATYAYLAESLPSKQVADVAYFIISEGALLTTTYHIFPHATVIEPADPEHRPKQIWLAFKNTFEWRLKQLHKGKIEVTGGTAEPDSDSTPPSDCLPIVVAAKPQTSYGRAATFKRLDVWRILTGQIKE